MYEKFIGSQHRYLQFDGGRRCFKSMDLDATKGRRGGSESKLAVHVRKYLTTSERSAALLLFDYLEEHLPLDSLLNSANYEFKAKCPITKILHRVSILDVLDVCVDSSNPDPTAGELVVLTALARQLRIPRSLVKNTSINGRGCPGDPDSDE